jgi:RNA polymerase sigma factor (sigma-70 family)
MTTERTLLADYAVNGSEKAFREVVTRYIDLVYSTAVRLVCGDTHLAEDVVQMVFADLARLARTLSPDVTLGGWLHRRTCHVALSLMRSQRRRQNRERQAAEMNAQQDPVESSFAEVAPTLDEAIDQLGAEDREAITLRFFERRDFRAVGEALGSTEDAAQKRVTRALEKLRGVLVRRGVAVSVAGLAVTLGAHAVTAAPAGLAASITTATLAGAKAGSSLTVTLVKLMAMSKLKVAVGAAVAAAIGMTLVLEYQAARQRQHQDKPQGLEAANLPLGSRSTGNLSAKNAAEPPNETEFNNETQTRYNNLKVWGLDFRICASKHNDRFPETWEQAFSVSQMHSSMPPAAFGAYMRQFTNDFEIVYRGETEGAFDPGKTMLFREKQPRRSPKGEWVKVYGFVDGTAQIHIEPDEAGFEAWEAPNLVGTR